MISDPPDPCKPKPTPLPVLAENIPAELRDRPQWVVWRYAWTGAKWDKPLLSVRGGPASSTAPKTWATFDEAIKTYLLGAEDDAGLDGIGFIPLPEDGLTIVDLDHCRDAATGEVEPWAAAIVAGLDTYTEASPSGTGLRIVALARKPDRLRSKSGDVEIYDGVKRNGDPGGRYLTITGQRIEGASAEVCERQEAITALHEQTFAPAAQHTPEPRRNGTHDPDDEALLRKARAAKNGAKFSALWDGGPAGASDKTRSAGDLALCRLLAFWTRKDAGRIDRLFRQSGRMRDKWERDDYRARTIEKAIAGCDEAYEPSVPLQMRRKGKDIILGYFREKYAPSFRRGPHIYAQGREIARTEACAAPDSCLVKCLLKATDAPLVSVKNPVPDEQKIPSFFKTWAGTAWADLIDSLPDESDSAEVAPDAGEEFRGLVAGALHQIVALGHVHHERGETTAERRSLVDWAHLFAKAGRWERVRSYQLWCRLEIDGDRRRLCLCLRVELFRQLGGGKLAYMTQRQFADLARLYGVGAADECRPGGRCAVELAPEFVADLVEGPIMRQDDAPVESSSREENGDSAT
jgi:hypothetical protein